MSVPVKVDSVMHCSQTRMMTMMMISMTIMTEILVMKTTSWMNQPTMTTVHYLTHLMQQSHRTRICQTQTTRKNLGAGIPDMKQGARSLGATSSTIVMIAPAMKTKLKAQTLAAP